MKRYLVFVVVGFACLALTTCQSGKAGLSQQDDAAIRQQDTDMVKVFNSGRPEWNAAVDAYYAEDAKILFS